MTTCERKQPVSVWMIVVFIIWLIINIRVEAGIAGAFERAVDGVVGGALLLTIIFQAMRFFKCSGQSCEEK